MPKVINKLSIYEFGKQLIDTKDLDPVYVILQHGKLPKFTLERWLLAYWCFYHMGTASWIAESPISYWGRFMNAAKTKELPRKPERRHFRGQNAINSVTFLKSKGVTELFAPFYSKGGYDAQELMNYVQTWVGFGPWISFKVADMLERLGLVNVNFRLDTVLYDSPQKGAEELWRRTYGTEPDKRTVGPWAIESLLTHLGQRLAPPRNERRINAQEIETVLCKWNSYLGGHYELGEDIEGSLSSLEQFQDKSTLAKRLLDNSKRIVWSKL